MVPEVLTTREAGAPVCPVDGTLLGFLDRIQGKDGRPFKGQAELAEALGWNERTVKKHVGCLEAKGVLLVLQDGNRKITYWVIHPSRDHRAIPADLTKPARRSRPHPGERAKAKAASEGAKDAPSKVQKMRSEGANYASDYVEGGAKDVPPSRSRYGKGLYPPGPATDPQPVPGRTIPLVSVGSNDEISDTDAAAIALMVSEISSLEGAGGGGDLVGSLGHRLRQMVDDADTKGVSAAEAMAALDIDGPTLDDLVQALLATEDAGLHGRRLYSSAPF